MRRLSGQTLIELLITVSVVTTGLFAAAALVFSNLQLSDRDADEVVAVNLAREGIELAKELRDSNWLAGDPFDQGLANGSDYTATPRWTGGAAEATFSFDFTASTMDDDNTVISQIADAASPGFYANGLVGNTTIWRRLMTFHPICDTAGGESVLDDGEDCAGGPKIGIRIESHLQWQRKGQVFDRVMYDDVYDWR
ncbi:MAG: type II secretion system protein [Patescibacteria group bacterium]